VGAEPGVRSGFRPAAPRPPRQRLFEVAADLGAVASGPVRWPQKAEETEPRAAGSARPAEDDAEIPTVTCSEPAIDRQQRRADRHPKAARQLLHDAADAGGAAQHRRGHVGIADRVQRQILDAADAAAKQHRDDDEPGRRVGAQQRVARRSPRPTAPRRRPGCGETRASAAPGATRCARTSRRRSRKSSRARPAPALSPNPT
jgi:hypothetical protein